MTFPSPKVVPLRVVAPNAAELEREWRDAAAQLLYACFRNGSKDEVQMRARRFFRARDAASEGGVVT